MPSQRYPNVHLKNYSIRVRPEHHAYLLENKKTITDWIRCAVAEAIENHRLDSEQSSATK